MSKCVYRGTSPEKLTGTIENSTFLKLSLLDDKSISKFLDIYQEVKIILLAVLYGLLL